MGVESKLHRVMMEAIISSPWLATFVCMHMVRCAISRCGLGIRLSLAVGTSSSSPWPPRKTTNSFPDPSRRLENHVYRSAGPAVPTHARNRYRTAERRGLDRQVEHHPAVVSIRRNQSSPIQPSPASLLSPCTFGSWAASMLPAACW